MVEGSDETTSADIPEEFLDLFEKRSFAVVTTVLPGGGLHGTVVWIDYDGTHLLVNSTAGRRKVKNVERDPRLCAVIMDPETGYRYLWVDGTVETVTTTGATSHIDDLAKRYLDVDTYPYHNQDAERVLLKIRPDTCHGYASRVMQEFQS